MEDMDVITFSINELQKMTNTELEKHKACCIEQMVSLKDTMKQYQRAQDMLDKISNEIQTRLEKEMQWKFFKSRITGKHMCRMIDMSHCKDTCKFLVVDINQDTPSICTEICSIDDIKKTCTEITKEDFMFAMKFAYREYLGYINY